MPLPIFPEDISETFSGGPNYNTSIVTKSGGKEVRNNTWKRPRWEFDFSITPFAIEEVRKVVNFFHGARGRWLPFRLRDPGDNEAVDELIWPIDGSTTQYQAGITYQDENGWFPSYFREIHFLRGGTVSAKVNGVSVSSSFSSGGVITLGSAANVGDVVTASFEFYVPVRFGEDKLDVEVLHSDGYTGGLGRIRGLSAIEVHSPRTNLLG